MPNPKTPHTTRNTMQHAEILSDLKSLGICDPSAALALVSARPRRDPTTNTSHEIRGAEDDVDLKRAKDLVELHYEVKERHKRRELASGLEEARRAVEGLGGRG
ncbi:hypothetical protein CC80DRAFT_399239 [Byssothecium circinans]|uniref:Uncharacterized protein n=1 Tax=Byssothecium circinans TaxID=147558 RepID=A0A6A5UEK6_9PLEO|nr:hypothetical protein CC80DRAFT_399239 [Byssothecium circinans]